MKGYCSCQLYFNDYKYWKNIMKTTPVMVEHVGQSRPYKLSIIGLVWKNRL